MARVMCQKFVTDRLKAPSTAEFPWNYDDQKVDILGPGHYRVSSFVDSQNGFGAQVRSTYVYAATATTIRGW
jgi:hypothetical protein